jgi:hypothetical protein
VLNAVYTGTIFGPMPRDYSRKLPKQMKQLARKSALRSDPFATFDELTEFGFSWTTPTLFRGAIA